MSDSPRPVAVITGASSGIGRCFARQLAERGCDLLVAARRENLLVELKQELEADFGIHVEPFPVDLAEIQEIQRLEQRVENCENLRYLINCAGFANGERFFPDVDVEAETRMLMVHNVAAMRLCRAALVPMRAKRCGYIVNVASVAGFAWLKGGADYCATKAFLITFSKAIQLDCKQSGVRVQALCPGFVRTEFFNSDDMRKIHAENRVLKTCWLKPDSVVRKSLAKLHSSKRVVYIPTLRYKFAVFMLRSPLFAPLRWMLLR